MSFELQLDLCFRARCTLVVVLTSEEDRALEHVKAVCAGLKRQALCWDLAEGFQWVSGSGAVPVARDAMTALEQIDRAAGEGVYVLRDFHDCWGNTVIRRKLRSLAQRLKFSKKTIVVTLPGGKLPDELKDEAVFVPLPPPGPAELEDVLERLTRTPGVRVDLTPAGREKLLSAALGLTAAQAQRIFAKIIVEAGTIADDDIDAVGEEKRLLIRESEALEFFPATHGVGDVGGLETLKEWLRLRERSFTREAREYGLPAPKGIALIGIPGTGKSLVAKMIAGLWRLPLFRLDSGALFGSLVGESEERTRRALRVADATAPSILWIDEIEKALAHGGLDSGTSMRVFGSILTWMQEKTAPVFVVATANDIRSLPAELLRKGRFDEIFFLDLPTARERREIFSVHLCKRRREPSFFDLDDLVRQSEGYVGSEIEQAVIDAMYLGFSEGREFTTLDIAAALRRQVPLAVSQRETVQALRLWLNEGRAQSASGFARSDSRQGFMPLDVPR